MHHHSYILTLMVSSRTFYIGIEVFGKVSLCCLIVCFSDGGFFRAYGEYDEEDPVLFPLEMP
jgi:hypothetical protein